MVDSRTEKLRVLLPTSPIVAIRWLPNKIRVAFILLGSQWVAMMGEEGTYNQELQMK